MLKTKKEQKTYDKFNTIKYLKLMFFKKKFKKNSQFHKKIQHFPKSHTPKTKHTIFIYRIHCKRKGIYFIKNINKHKSLHLSKRRKKIHYLFGSVKCKFVKLVIFF